MADPLRLAIALIPLAAYALLLGVVNMRRRPLVVTGGSDLATLAAAMTGLVFVGPIELFRPDAATSDLGNSIWLMLLALYWLWAALAVLVSRPRLVVYNVSIEELRPALAEAVAQLDPRARWAGDALALPSLGVQLHLDAFELMRNVSLASTGGAQSLEGWRRLRRALERSLAGLVVPANPRCASFFTLALAFFLLPVLRLWNHPEEVAQAIREVLAF